MNLRSKKMITLACKYIFMFLLNVIFVMIFNQKHMPKTVHWLLFLATHFIRHLKYLVPLVPTLIF
jgi:L-cystine uptake protein TcyP (sodium:dicarboxylate symporter family)